MSPGHAKLETVTAEETVLAMWCRLTGTRSADLTDEQRHEFLTDTRVAALARTPYAVLLESGVTAACRGRLDLDEWLTHIARAPRSLV